MAEARLPRARGRGPSGGGRTRLPGGPLDPSIERRVVPGDRSPPHARAHVAQRLRDRQDGAGSWRRFRFARFSPATPHLAHARRGLQRSAGPPPGVTARRLQPRLRARRLVSARRADDDVGRAHDHLAIPSPEGRRANHRRGRHRHTGYAGGSPRQADRHQVLPGAVDRARRDHEPLEARRRRSWHGP